MKNLSLIVLIIFLFPVIPAAAEDIHLVTDRFWNMVLEEELQQSSFSRLILQIKELWPFQAEDRIRIDGTAVERHVIGVMDSDSEMQAIRQVLRDKNGIVILSPMLALYGCELAEENPELRFFVPCAAPPSECRSGNIFYYIFDYSEAMYAAGAWAAGQTLNVSALFYTGEIGYKERSEAFREGWTSVKGADTLKITEIRSPGGINERSIEDFKSSLPDDGGLAAVFAGPWNNSAIEAFDGSSVQILSEYMLLWRESGYNAAASIELGPERIISEIIKSISIDTYSTAGALKAEFFLYDTE